ncbi:hypothetical protein BP5796_04924 [Coleophoma crateriformis]|uniref:Peptidase A1 domain-containing protein n=1 Tax=Coleophoma crateriformis TaxID=565419 RepID=A0A3D8SAY6_9HELO|nr:hypothetical protein BP5796_04924 [Coleophoma crateriformis]
MKSSFLLASSLSTLVSSLSSDIAADAPFHYIPIDYNYGYNERVTANLTYGTATDAQPVRTVLDTGSANFWVWGPGAVINYGSQYLGFTGPCNMSVPLEYDLLNSTTAVVTNHSSYYSYGGNGKILSGTQYSNDTITASGGNGAISNTQFALATHGQLRQYDNGSCLGTTYDLAILGLAPYTTDLYTAGPLFRQTLYETGAVAARTMVMWFNQAVRVGEKFTGGALFGAIDTSKFTGPLVRVPNAGGPVGLYVHKPLIKINGKTFNTSYATDCLVDSGTHADSLPFSYTDNQEAAFYNATKGMLMAYNGVAAYNGPCSAIPANYSIGYEFAGVNANESITINVPIRNYARSSSSYANASDAATVCPLNMDLTSDCVFGATFFTALFLAHDESDGSIAFAQGGVASEGSELNTASFRAFGAGESF